jgi:cytochrome c oxidase subunit 2
VKKDLVPGRYNYLWFEAEPGTYQAFCAEYCGTEHSQMTATVRVLPQEEFDAQIANLAAWIDDYGEEELYKAGYRLFARCQSCHSLDGTVKTGPSFVETHEMWGEPRAMMSGENVIVDENYVRNSILNPGEQIASPYGSVMPSFQGQLKVPEVSALIEFIRRLDEVVDEQGNPKIDLEAQAGGSNS